MLMIFFLVFKLAFIVKEMNLSMLTAINAQTLTHIHWKI